MKRLLEPLILLLLLLVGACADDVGETNAADVASDTTPGDTGSPDAADAEADADDTGTSDAADDTGTPDAEDAEADADVAAPEPDFPDMPRAGAQPLPRARLVVESSRYTDFFDTERERGVFSAALIASREGGPCEVDIIEGYCALERCDRSPQRVDAGPLTLTVQGSEAATLTFDDVSGRYPSLDTSEAWFRSDEAVVVSGAGSSAAPAFSIEATAPGSLTLTAPSLPEPPGIIDIPSQLDWELTWEPATGERLVVELRWRGSDDARSLSCHFDGADGSGVIPAAALAQMPLDEHELAAWTQRTTWATEGDWTLSLTARAMALRSAGQRWTARAMLR